jgi:methyl-accepting chemotaxis protein
MTNTAAQPGSQQAGYGLSILAKLVLAFLAFILLLGVLMFVVYQRFVPPLVEEQIDLRAEAITKTFASAALQPTVERNYLQVNKLAEGAAKLPGVAYASAVNAKGIPIAGIFADLGQFDANFTQVVKQSGFPKDIFAGHGVPEGADKTKARFMVGGQEILDYGMRLGESGAQVHVGLFTADVDKAVARTIWPLIALLGVMTLLGIGAVTLIAQAVSRPIHQLAEQADYISQGHLEREIDIKASGEVGQLAQAFKRMQAAIRYSVVQLRKQQARQHGGDA